jgi:hypothetical protein
MEFTEPEHKKGGIDIIIDDQMESYPGIDFEPTSLGPHVVVDGSKANPKHVNEVRKYYEDKKITYTLTVKGKPEN